MTNQSNLFNKRLHLSQNLNLLALEWKRLVTNQPMTRKVIKVAKKVAKKT